MPWAKPAIRETMKKHLRVHRAQEELTRCNVEIRRVLSSIHDEDRRFSDTLRSLKDQKSSILGPVMDYCTRRRRINSLLLGHIEQIFDLDGYTGSRTVGCKKGCRATVEGTLERPAYHWQAGGGDDLKEGDGEEIDDGETNQVDGLLDFVTKL